MKAKAERHISRAPTGVGRGRGAGPGAARGTGLLWGTTRGSDSGGERQSNAGQEDRREGRGPARHRSWCCPPRASRCRSALDVASRPLMSFDTQPLRLGCWRTEKNRQHKASGQLPGVQRAGSARTQALPVRSRGHVSQRTTGGAGGLRAEGALCEPVHGEDRLREDRPVCHSARNVLPKQRFPTTRERKATGGEGHLITSPASAPVPGAGLDALHAALDPANSSSGSAPDSRWHASQVTSPFFKNATTSAEWE